MSLVGRGATSGGSGYKASPSRSAATVIQCSPVKEILLWLRFSLQTAGGVLFQLNTSFFFNENFQLGDELSDCGLEVFFYLTDLLKFLTI